MFKSKNLKKEKSTEKTFEIPQMATLKTPCMFTDMGACM